MRRKRLCWCPMQLVTLHAIFTTLSMIAQFMTCLPLSRNSRRKTHK